MVSSVTPGEGVIKGVKPLDFERLDRGRSDMKKTIFVKKQKKNLKEISACGWPTICIYIILFTNPGTTDLRIPNTPYVAHLIVNRMIYFSKSW